MVKSRRIDVRLDNKLYYLLVLILVVLGVNGLVYAYNSDWGSNPGEPNIVGHTPDEIMVSDSEGNLVTLAELTNQYNSVISQNFENNNGVWSPKGGGGLTCVEVSSDDSITYCPKGYEVVSCYAEEHGVEIYPSTSQGRDANNGRQYCRASFLYNNIIGQGFGITHFNKATCCKM